MEAKNYERLAPRVFAVVADEHERSLMFATLHSLGYGVDFSGSCEEGRLRFAAGRYACVVIDLALPDRDGSILLSAFAEIDPHVVPIALVDSPEANAILNTIHAGAFDCLTRPIEEANFTAAISRAFSHHDVIRERGELFRLLREERDQLRTRVESATNDVRLYATACENTNARLRALLTLTQSSSRYWSDELLIRHMFDELVRHLPLLCMAFCDISGHRLSCVYKQKSGEVRFARMENDPASLNYDALLVGAEPDLFVRSWVERAIGADTKAWQSFTYPVLLRNRSESIVAFYLDWDHVVQAIDREFLDMCAYFVAFELEQGNLLLQVAHQASLGNIAVELTRNFLQPLTAIRTAAEFIKETLVSDEAATGIEIIRESVERLRLQMQEFRKLSMLREDVVETVHLDQYIEQALEVLAVSIQNRGVTIEKEFPTDCECVLLNGTALARTFLDLILGALRSVDIGGKLLLALRETDRDHLAFELSHNGATPSSVLGLTGSALPLSPGAEREHPTLQLAGRTVHACGGMLTIEQEGERRGVLRVVLPRNATRYRSEQEGT